MKGIKSLTIVIKLGTSSIVDEKTHEPLLPILSLIVATAVELRKEGHKVVIVSSGAIGVGLRTMDFDKRPKHLSSLQALAAIGQCHLIHLWDSLFSHYRQPIAQILLTRNDIADRTRYLNAQSTLMELLHMGVIPIVNENDTIAVAEIKFGDNDTLSAIASAMVHADMLFLMTDVDCLYDKNPRTSPDAKPIEVVRDISEITADVSQAGSALGTGGMSTKIVAARLATSAGVTTVITRSSAPGNLPKIARYIQATKRASQNLENPVIPIEQPPLHTRFLPIADPIRDRHFWVLHGLAPHGTVYIDEGAHRALIRRAGLLPVGVVGVEGHFGHHESVRLVVAKRRQTPDEHGRLWEDDQQEIGRGLTNYSSSEIARIQGEQSSKIKSILGYADSGYVAEREFISLLRNESRPPSPGDERTPSCITTPRSERRVDSP
ncbi:Glutamate 5-kinase [Ceratocystis lukuohia]|uniref:Glutamate 5-kinase n=1 Tax=Ceratocystis lukuohia TaxID=2019550 RepID=A0ABR4MDS5_9PEZI